MGLRNGRGSLPWLVAVLVFGLAGGSPSAAPSYQMVRLTSGRLCICIESGTY